MYRLDGLLSSQSFPSSITETVGYDGAKRPVSISLGAAGSISQAFDRAGNVTSDGRSLTGIAGDAGSGTQTFGYDGLSRLLSSSGVTSAAGTYEFDLDGNRVKRVEGGITTTFAYDRTDQVVTQTIGAVTSTFAHDRYGNLTTSYDKNSAATSYTRDASGRLTGITPPAGGAITFALDRHTTRSVGGVLADTYAYLDATETAWQSGTGPTSALLDVDGSRLAVKTGGTVSWLVFDLHGSVAALANTSGTLTDAYRFNGWGEQVASAGSAVNPWRYRGLLNIGPDSTTGALLDMAARDYSPHLGTFTQQDSYQGSAANPASMNRFLYAHANPATLIDPDGHRPLGTCDPNCDSTYDAGADIRIWNTNKQEATRPKVVTSQQAAPADNDLFTGFNPWAVDADPTLTSLYSQLTNECNDLLDQAACDVAGDIFDWKKRNRDMYCFFHRAECDAHDRDGLHNLLGAGGMLPVIGILFDGADALLYIGEGDLIGAGMAIGFALPLVGDAARAGKLGVGLVEGATAAQRATPEELVAMMNKRPDVDARIASTADEIEYLQLRDAAGSTMDLGGKYDVLLRVKPSRDDVLHEWLHVLRSRRGTGGAYGEHEWIDSFLANHSRILGLDT
jgi:RHS repeat-associated protein